MEGTRPMTAEVCVCLLLFPLVSVVHAECSHFAGERDHGRRSEEGRILPACLPDGEAE